MKESVLAFLCWQPMFSGKYIVNEALTLHKIHKYSVGFLNQKFAMCLSSVRKIAVKGQCPQRRWRSPARICLALPCTWKGWAAVIAVRLWDHTISSAAVFAAFQAGFTVNQDFSVSNLFHDLFSYFFFKFQFNWSVSQFLRLSFFLRY